MTRMKNANASELNLLPSSELAHTGRDQASAAGIEARTSEDGRCKLLLSLRAVVHMPPTFEFVPLTRRF